MAKYLAYLLFTSLTFTACTSNSVFESNVTIKDRLWTYDEKAVFDVNIDDKNAKYDIFINLRHNNNYHYSNIFLLLNEKGKGLKDTAYRKEIPLAALDGKWYGKSAGSLFEVVYLAKENFMFPDTGKYTFSIEQNMRDNPLENIVDVGIKVIKK